LLGSMLLPGHAVAAYKATVTSTAGGSWTTVKLVIQDQTLLLKGGKIQVPFQQVQSVNYSFIGFPPEKCTELLQNGEFEALESGLSEIMAPVLKLPAFQGNLDEYLLWLIRARFWAGKYDTIPGLITGLRNLRSPLTKEAGLYHILTILEQGKTEEAATLFQTLEKKEKLSATAMPEYIRGRLSFSAKKYKTALKYFSNVVVFHSRDLEWMPAATFYEGMVYKKTGYLVAAGHVADELKMVYPDTYWSRRASELDIE